MDFHPREYRPRSVKSHDKCPEAATHDRSPLPRPSALRRHVYIRDILKETRTHGANRLPQVQEPNVVDDHKPIGSMYAKYGNSYHQYTPNVSIYIYSIHGSYGKL